MNKMSENSQRRHEQVNKILDSGNIKGLNNKIIYEKANRHAVTPWNIGCTIGYPTPRNPKKKVFSNVG